MNMMFGDMDTLHETVFSEDRLYRYRLVDSQAGPGSGTCMFLMLNPSTADEVRSDPTVTRCKGFTALWGYKRLIVANIFAYRSTDPKALKLVTDPVGPLNDEHIVAAAHESERVVLAWGRHGALLNRGGAVVKLLRDEGLENKTCYLKLTKDGHPGHPLYIASSVLPTFGLPELQS